VPHSIFTGRAMPQPGESLFLEEDTAAAVALAEEERDTCSQCGMPRAWCRDPANQFAFDVHESTCWPTYRLAQYRSGEKWKAKLDDTRDATQLSAFFRDGHEPEVDAGLGLSDVDVDEVPVVAGVPEVAGE
jgi:hypothetical protein